MSRIYKKINCTLIVNSLFSKCKFSIGQRYDDILENARVNGIERNIILSIRVAYEWILYGGFWAVGILYGFRLSRADPATNSQATYTVGEILFVLATTFKCVFGLTDAMLFMNNLARARMAAGDVFNIIERVYFHFPYSYLSRGHHHEYMCMFDCTTEADD